MRPDHRDTRTTAQSERPHRDYSVPFGFVTSECTPEMQSAAEAAGALFFIIKPFTPERFKEALITVLG